MNVLLELLILCVLIYITCRLLTWLLICLGRKFLKLNVEIGSIGLFACTNVKLHIKRRFTLHLEVEKLWLSSCYVNKNTKKSLGICFSGVRLQVDLPETPASNGEVQKKVHSLNKAKQGVNTALNVIKLFSIHAENICCMVRGGKLAGCILHITAEELRPDVSPSKGSLHISSVIDNAAFKVLCPGEGATGRAPCQGEITFSHKAEIMIDMCENSPIVIQELTSEVISPVVEIHRDLIRYVYNHGVNNAIETHKNDDLQKERIISIQPDSVNITFSAIKTKICDGNRELCLAVDLVQVQGTHKKLDSLSHGDMEFKIKGVTGKSTHIHVCSLHALCVSIHGDDKVVEAKCQLLNGFVGYHGDELRYWFDFLPKTTQRTVLAEPHGSRGSKLEPKLTQFGAAVGNRQLKLSFQAKNLSCAVASASCAGIKLGLSEAKLDWMTKDKDLSDNSCWHDYKCDIELSNIYVKLTEGGPASVELSPRTHHLNTLLYTSLLLIKASAPCIDIILDSCQVELSTGGLNVLNSLSNNILSLKKDRSGVRLTDGEKRLEKPKKDGSVLTKLINRPFIVNSHCTNVNIYMSYEHKVCAVARIDQIKTGHKDEQHDIAFERCNLTYLSQLTKRLPITRACDAQNTVLEMKHLSLSANRNDKHCTIEIKEGLNITWSMGLHMCILEVYREVIQLKNILGNSRAKHSHSPDSDDTSSWRVDVKLNIQTTLILSLQNDHEVEFSCPKFVFQKNPKRTTLYLEGLNIIFDQHNVVTMQEILATTDHHSDKMALERQAAKQLIQPTNRAWIISFEKITINFPFSYNFAASFQELKNVNKWRKLVHNVQKKPFTVESKLPPDLIIRVKYVKIIVEDDPFEIKLGDNYKLISDEHIEQQKRIQALNARIISLRKKHGLLPASKVEELYRSLEESRSEHYIRRSRALYAACPMRTVLWYWTMENLDLTILADTSLHGKENVLKHMKDVDSQSPYAPEDMVFVTLWCRYVNVQTSSFVIGLRDYLVPIFNIEDLQFAGRLIGAEQKGSEKARRTCSINQGLPWGSVTVERNMPALKFYHDFTSKVGQFNIAYGGCMEPAMAQFNHSLNKINRPSLDPSRPLPFWDKLRLLIHGRVMMSVRSMSWMYHASLDPYNKTEMMDWTWTNLNIDWTNAKWIFHGDLDIYARTASKYDDCCLLHLPNLKLKLDLHWLTNHDPNDHHVVEPCAPEKRSQLQDQDSYAGFRSNNLNIEITFQTKMKQSTVPSCLFYASTLRWMDKIKMCMARVSRPIRRGKVFNYTPLRKSPLGRHVKELTFHFKVHQFEVDYWASFARQSGVHVKGGRCDISMALQQTLALLEDGLVHRMCSNWKIQHFNGELHDVTVWLCSVAMGRHSKRMSDSCSVPRSYFLSVRKISYQRTDTEVLDGTHLTDVEAEVASHRVMVHDLKGAWTPSNRDVAMALYDGYVNSQQIKKNLRSEALQGFKVDSSQSPSKLNRSLNTSGAKALFMMSSPPACSVQNDPMFSMLQQLVNESGTKFVAAVEEMPEPETLVKQLHGIAVCDTDDVTTKKWLVELYNSQVVLRGRETAGYVIVSAAKASLLVCDHKPIWQAQQLKSKSSLVGSVEAMQYYATVETNEDDDILWLSKEHIAEQRDTAAPVSIMEGMIGLADMVGSGQCVGGVVSDVIGTTRGQHRSSVQLQRIVSRCRCEFFYAGYGEVEDRTLPEVPLPHTESDMMKKEEGIDCFTLLHHDLNVCTNSLQYDMILDIVNNLLLHVEPKKKELTEKLQSMRFSLQLASVDDLKTPILQRQNDLRSLMARTRQLEREIYNVHRSTEEQLSLEELSQLSYDLQRQLEDCKEQCHIQSEKLAMIVSCYKEIQLQVMSNLKASQAQREAPVSRLYEVCIKHAEWRMTEDDGQIGIADLVLKNFLYTKQSCEDDSGAHQLELGYVKVTNLLPGTPYREVLVPRDMLGKISDRLPMLRILCKFKAPVGGISLKEHFEVNVAPITIQLTNRFYKTAMSYFFRDKQEDVEVEDDELASISEHHPTVVATARAKRKEEKQESHRGSRHSSQLSLVADVDKMKARAAKNNMFLYIKIPEVPLRVSYKGVKEKNITNINDFQFLLPTLEYHEQTWTWHDLALAVKNDCKKRLIAQAVQQKLNIKTQLFDFLQDEVHEEEDKAKILIGTKLFGTSDKKSSKKSLFGSKGSKS